MEQRTHTLESCREFLNGQLDARGSTSPQRAIDVVKEHARMEQVGKQIGLFAES